MNEDYIMTFVFPYEKVEKGSKVIIYGMGDAGKQYLAQLLKSGYATVPWCIDGLGFSTINKLHDVIIYPPEKLKTVNNKEYDYIIISIVDTEQANNVYKALVNFNIPDKKIIWSIDVINPIKSFRNHDIQKYFQPSFSWEGEDTVIKAIFMSIGV